MSEGPRPRRRGFRYSVRAFFLVLTAACPWLGWNVNVVKQRKMLREQERQERTQFKDCRFGFVNASATPPAPPVASATGEQQVRYWVRLRDYQANVKLKMRASRPVASSRISWFRQWLGDEPVDLILVFNQADHDVARARFPEAYVYVMPPRR